MVVSPCRMSLSCLAGLAIVVVEDHDDARRHLDLFLGQLGAKVTVTSNAFEGLELIKILSRFSVVLHKNAGYWPGSNCG
jgi:CheY-like chemotaxis protein